jgi:hypothetical protein
MNFGGIFGRNRVPGRREVALRRGDASVLACAFLVGLGVMLVVSKRTRRLAGGAIELLAGAVEEL